MKIMSILFLTFFAVGSVMAAKTSVLGQISKESAVKSRFVTTTYQVAVENQTQFVALLVEAEKVMRAENLITSGPILRMRSIANPKLIMEVYEWVDDKAFDRAQNTPSLLAVWGKFESVWEDGGFGVNRFPESSQPWAQYEAIH